MKIYSYRKENPKYHGFVLKPSYVYGRDDTSPFVTCFVRSKEDVGVMMLWRLHMERGWCECWEKSETTHALALYAMEHGRTPHSMSVQRTVCSNRCSEVPRKHRIGTSNITRFV